MNLFDILSEEKKLYDYYDELFQNKQYIPKKDEKDQIFYCAFITNYRESQELTISAGDLSRTGKKEFAALGKLTALIGSIRFRHPETNALLLALLTGRKEGMDKETLSAFRAAGASHILALSGLHLGIIYMIVSKLLSILGNSRMAASLRSCLIVAFSAYYVLMTGTSPSIVRAFLFITLSEIASHCPGRRKTPLSVWCTALLIQLVFRPGAISSTGFRLSYLAMLGIFTLFPCLKAWYPAAGNRLGKRDPVRRIWESVALSISCQAFTAPLVWFTFHTFPKYFLITNLTALPLTEGLMVFGIASTVLAAAGISIPALTDLTDMLSTALHRTLRTIASMQECGHNF